MGYSGEQLRELEEALNRIDADIILSGTPIDLSKVIRANKPIIRVRYELSEKGRPDLNDAVKEFLEKKGEK